MTTIIVVVVVALVFFVAVCVVAFMVWKRESEMRTDSIRAIEQNLERLAHDIQKDDVDKGRETAEVIDADEAASYMESLIAESVPVKPGRKRKRYDPFGWVRDADEEVRIEETYEAATIIPVEEKEELSIHRTEDIEAGSNASEAEVKEDSEESGDMLSEDIVSDSDSNEGEPEKENGELKKNDDSDDIDETDQAEEEKTVEISFDFIKQLPGNDLIVSDQTGNEDDVSHRQQMGYDVGRSGKKYTASELETLIKE